MSLTVSCRKYTKNAEIYGRPRDDEFVAAVSYPDDGFLTPACLNPIPAMPPKAPWSGSNPVDLDRLCH